jgi:hypothetical protein
MEKQAYDLTNGEGKIIRQGPRPTCQLVTVNTTGKVHTIGETICILRFSLDSGTAMECDVVNRSYIALNGMKAPPLSTDSAEMWLQGQEDTFGFRRIIMPDMTSACFNAAQSIEPIEEVLQWLSLAAVTFPGDITALRKMVVIYPENVCGSLGTTVICHDPKVMSFLMLAIPILGSVGQPQRHSGLVSIRHLNSKNSQMAESNSVDTYMTESSESGSRAYKKTADSWAVVASRPRSVASEVVGKKLHAPHLFDSNLPPHMLMQVDNKKVGPGRVVLVEYISDVDPLILQITVSELLADGCSYNNMDDTDQAVTTEYWMSRVQVLFRYGRQYVDNRTVVGFCVLIDFGAQHKVVCDTLNGQKLPFGSATMWLGYSKCVCRGCMLEKSVDGAGLCNECGEEGHFGGDPVCSVMIGLAERRQEKAVSQHLPRVVQKPVIPMAEPVRDSSAAGENEAEEQGSNKRTKATGEKEGEDRAAATGKLGRPEGADESISEFPPLQAARSVKGRGQTGVEGGGKKGDQNAGRGAGKDDSGRGPVVDRHEVSTPKEGAKGTQAVVETQAPMAGYRVEQLKLGRARVKAQGVCPFCHKPTGLTRQHNWKECTEGRFSIPAPHKQDHSKCLICGHRHPFDECPVWTDKGAGGQPMLSEDCLAMCEHMAVPSYQVGGRTYLNLSGKRTVTAADTDSVEGSVSEASAVVYGGNVSIEQVKGSADPKVVQLLELISADSRQMRVELGRVTTQLEEQAKATALQGETLSRVMDQMGVLQTATAERIDEIQKAQTTVAEDQKKALARMDAALAKMRAGDTAVVGPPSTLMQP